MYRLGPYPVVANGDKTWRCYRIEDGKYVGTIRHPFAASARGPMDMWHAVTPTGEKSRYLPSETSAASWLLNIQRRADAKAQPRGFGARGAL